MRDVVFEFIPNLADAGAETIVSNYCIMSNSIKIVPLVLWAGTESANVRTLRAHNVEVLSVYKRNIFSRIFNKMFGKYYVPYKINRLLKLYNGKIIHVHLALLDYAERVADKNPDVYFFYTCHNEVGYYFPNKKTQQFLCAQKLLKKNRLTIVALHEKMQQELKEFFQTDKVLIFKNGIDFNKYQQCQIDKMVKRQSLKIPENAFVLGHVGRFTEQKNHKKLIEVFSAVKEKQPDAFLLMVGEGELKSEVEKMMMELHLENSYLILSKRSDVNELLQIMDVFVFPSLFEGFSVVLLEAQVSGLKCVVSDSISESAFLSDKVYALSLDENAQVWSKCILLDQGSKEKTGDIKQYDLNKIIDDIEKCYSNAIAEK